MKKMTICDSHNDFLTELKEEEIKPYLEDCKKAGVKKVAASFWSSKMEPETIKAKLLTRAKIIKNHKCALLHLEDLFWLQTEEDLNFLCKLKPFSCSLTWNDKNILAGGAHSTAGLTKWGEKVIAKCLENGIIVDLAHLNSKSFYKAAHIIKKNLYCSHTGFKETKQHPRNLTDKQIDLIVKSNGFIGLYFFDKATDHGDEFIIDDIVKNIKYFTTRWGCDNLGIGSDFYGLDILPKGLNKYSDFQNLKAALKNDGYTETECDKLLYKNFLNFIKRVENGNRRIRKIFG